MIFTTRMKHLIAAVLDEDIERVTRELLRQGSLHFVKITEFDEDLKHRVEDVEPEISRSVLEETKDRIEAFLNLIGERSTYNQALDLTHLKVFSLDDTNKVIDGIAAEIQKKRDRQKVLQQEILKIEDIHRHVDLLEELGDSLRGMQKTDSYSFLEIQIGNIPSVRMQSFSASLKIIPSVFLTLQQTDDQTAVLLITMKRDSAQVNKMLEQHRWSDIELPETLRNIKGDVIDELDANRRTLKSEQAELEDEVKKVVLQERNTLLNMWENIRLNELYSTVQSYFNKTSRTVLFSGWIPISRQSILGKGIREVTAGRCYLAWSDPEIGEQSKEAAAPVEIRNPRFLSPFERIVRNYAIPEYGTVDPTPLVAIAYLLMFGLMFGDAGHGFVLAATGFLAARYYRSKHSGRYTLFNLVTWCGCSAIVFGILFGSYFGMQWFAPLWFDYHGIIVGHPTGGGYFRDIYDILVLTIYFGVAVIGLGLLLNWFNLIVKKKWFVLLFDKGGLIGGWMYTAGVYVAYYFVNHKYKELPNSQLLFLLLGLPAIILVVKGPLEYFIHRKRGQGKRTSVFILIDFFMEWIVELLEIFSGYLANTLSFMRVAGLGIAHVSLMTAFFEIAGMLAIESSGFDPGYSNYSVWSYLILIFGNVLVIGLEGLSAGIQSLRLNYYEFFSKYFSGRGRAYTPVSLQATT